MLRRVCFRVSGINTDINYRGWYSWCVAGWIIIGLTVCSTIVSFVEDAYKSFFYRRAKKSSKTDVAAEETRL